MNDSTQTRKTNMDDKNFTAIAQYIKDAQHGHKRSIPPLAQWHPKHCGTMDLVIKANGEWWHEGQLIQRQALINLFASVLCKQDERFYLKTPVELVEIKVEDEPLYVTQVEQVQIAGQNYLQLMTHTEDLIIVDHAHPIFMRDYEGQARAYVHVRDGLNATLNRASFFHLVELGQLIENQQGDTVLLLQSGDFHLQLKA